ncbi:MAG: bifunctional UDP-N-acetylglucosamine diphosphorylase/glucosamine-1-phosphate N-acetyltransferase GlmU [Oscillospiraceae bacterium]|nr:bifunctional UDP-N-acetylglucosamine diphosphorylase/glucosamine-1-phosphate N-acetyltransferase GlmU [Oscillospiraceae bacterium]
MLRNRAVILAAGEGTRMKSQKPKVLAEVLYKPMIDWVIGCAFDAGFSPADICVVTGYGRELLLPRLPNGVSAVVQERRLGTGHAVMQAGKFISGADANVLILCGDAPFIDSETVCRSLEHHTRAESAVTVISAEVENPFGYGRIVRGGDGAFLKIAEEKEASDLEKLIREVNSGAYWFNAQALLLALDRLAADGLNGEKEYYLTDAVKILRSAGYKTATFTSPSADCVLGANDRVQLAGLNEIARQKVLHKHMLNGVSIPFADGVVIGPDAAIGADTEIMPGTVIIGASVIGAGCVIGPDSYAENSRIGDRVRFQRSWAQGASVDSDSLIGPFARLRPGASLGRSVKLGNFVEIKNSSVGDGTKIPHLTYIGDSDIGSGVNVGCGCATVNYTGRDKFRTVIENGAFIGCGTSLVAPVTVGENAYTAAGSTITENVPANSLAIARVSQTVKKDWVIRKKPYSNR